jgi:gas vesicle protein
MKNLFNCIVGALLGGVLALLFAPSRGDVTRARIRNSFTNIRNEVQEAASTKANLLKAELARLQNKPTP